jgi:hypothetical protein
MDLGSRSPTDLVKSGIALAVWEPALEHPATRKKINRYLAKIRVVIIVSELLLMEIAPQL